jgi:AcrR family transcriptional regulator
MPAPTKRLPRAEREARMLDAAERAFARDGFAGSSMESIAVESGITKALLYQYFGSKEGLYVQCVERLRRELFDRIAATAAAATDPVGRLMAITDLYFDELSAQRDSPVILYGDAPRAAVDEMRERNAQTIAAILTLDFADADLDDIALASNMVVGAGEQVGRWWAQHPDVPAAQVRAGFARAVGSAIQGVLG